MIYVLYNPLADNRNGRSNAERIGEILETREVRYLDVTGLDAAEFLAQAGAQDKVVLSGGDGTLHHFVNDCGGQAPAHPVYYYPSGSGNDFMADVRAREQGGLVLLNPYMQHLPVVRAEGQTRFFLNGVGYGIDGYCCEEGDRRRAAGVKKINYTAIAVKGLLFHYRPTGATVTVDGVRRRYEKVWLAPTMHGRFYGGGMIPTPEQDRFSESGSVSTMIFHGSGKLKTLRIFPSIFQGDHIRRTDAVEVLTGHDVTVEFDRPTPLQIDGETISGVRAYHVAARVPAAVS